MKALVIRGLAVAATSVCFIGLSDAGECPFGAGDRIAFLGDSITEFGSRSEEGWVKTVERSLRAKIGDLAFVEAGVAGHMSHDMAARLDKDVLSKKPDWMFFSCGVNDTPNPVVDNPGYPLADYKKKVNEIFDRCAAAGVKVICLTATPVLEAPNYRANELLKDYNTALRAIALARNLPIVEIWQAFDTRYAAKDDPNVRLYTVDGTHLNAVGDRLFAERILEFAGVPLVSAAATKDVRRLYAGIAPGESRLGLPNPERGWRFEIGVGIHESDPYKFTHVKDQWPFPRFKADGVTVSQAYCYLSQFHDSPISEGKIAALEASFARARREGYKFLLRFAYDYDPYLKPTPTKERILKHIAQLKPIVRRNIDVIYCLQTGWVGAWGEFHSTASGVDKDPKAVGEIVRATLDMLPPERSTMMRLVEYKLTALEAMGSSTNEVTAATAWTQTPTARIGFFNDGTLANWWDGGTFRTEPYADEDQWAFERVRREGLYTPVDGELFWTGQYSHPVFACGLRAIDRFSKQHYTTFSLVHGHSLLDQSPRPWTIDGWKVTPVTADELKFFGVDYDPAYFEGVPSRTAYEFIRDHLGYRLALREAVLPPTDGKRAKLRLVLHNYGFSAPVNPREPIVVALRNDGAVREIPTGFDCRRLAPGKDMTVEVALARQAGERLALWLPDATPSLHLRPDYAIRLATHLPVETVSGRLLHILD